MGAGGKRLNSGRKKGIENNTTGKLRLDLIETLNEQGVDPAESLAWVFKEAKEQYEKKKEESANGWGSMGLLDLARHAACDLMDYVYPKRKAIELTGKDGKELFTSLADVVKHSADIERNKKA